MTLLCLCMFFNIRVPEVSKKQSGWSENKFSSRILYTTCFAACISGPLDVPKGFHATPTVTTVVQMKQSLFDLSLAKCCLKQVSVFCKIILLASGKITKTIFR